MILYTQSHGNDRQWYKIMSPEDLGPVHAAYPMTREIAMDCHTLEEAVESIAEYLDGHGMSAWVEDKELSKSLKNKAIAIGLALGASAPAHIDQMPHPKAQPSLHATPVQAEQPKDMFGSHPNDRFLWNIKQIESSGGKNTEHKPIASGRFKGKRAIGRWGLLKPTVHELISRMRMAGTLTPEYQALEPMSRDQLDEHFKHNPQIELGLARQLATHVLKRQHGNMHRAAYSWLHGHNIMPNDIANEKLMNSDYVNKFRSFDQINPFVKKPVAMKKTMPEVGSEDFRMRVKNWYKRREEEVTEDPMRSSNFQPDPGRIRDNELDDIKPDSMKTSIEKLADNVKRVNKER